jgi:hypothetical protein
LDPKAHSYDEVRSDDEMTIRDMISIAFFLLLHLGEYTGNVSDDATFKLQVVHVYIHKRCLDSCTTSESDIKEATLVSYNFTTQKNGHCN